MTNSHATSLLGVIRGVLDDARDIFPNDHREFDRDFSRLTSLLEHRGLACFTLDLPAAGKLFDRAIDDGRFERSSAPLMRRYKNTSVIPRLFRGLLRRVFNDDGMLKVNPNVQAILVLRQLYNVGKKLKVDCDPAKVYATVAEFVRTDAALPLPSLDWDATESETDRLDSLSYESYRASALDMDGFIPGIVENDPRAYPTITSDVLRHLQQVADIVATTLGVFDPYEWHPKHGPGAVADLRAYESKYRHKHWPASLESVFPQADFAYANHSLWADDASVGLGADSIEVASRLIAVPKTQKGPRLIAAEPSALQFCQQAIWEFLEKRCVDSWLNGYVRFRDQTFNQQGALRASTTQQYWTVDLSSASDRVSLRFVERLFRRNPTVVRALHATRTRYLIQKLDKKSPTYVKLRKFATMGSACTFPVETLGFLTVALACLTYVRHLRPSITTFELLSGEVRVFGDDIVIPSDAGEMLQDLLGYLDFQVNQSKTYRHGRFRESCGLEVFDGVDVTPSYVLRSYQPSKPESVISVVQSSNNFFLKGWWRAATVIKQTVTRHKIASVPAGSGLFGWWSFSSGTDAAKRWNPILQREEFETMTLRAKSPRTPVNHGSSLLQWFTEAPLPDLPWVSGVGTRVRTNLVRARVDCALLAL